MKKLTKEQYIFLAGLSVFLFAIVYIIINRKKILSYAKQKVWDVQTEIQISTLHPKNKKYARELINRADKELGMKLIIPKDGGNRTFERQTELWNQGRTTGGKIVTYAQAGQSYHNYGLAFDVVETKDGQIWGYNISEPLLNPNLPKYPMERWEKIGALGKKIGLEWGGDWAGAKRDLPHFQKTFGKSESQLLAMKQAGDETGGYVNV